MAPSTLRCSLTSLALGLSAVMGACSESSDDPGGTQAGGGAPSSGTGGAASGASGAFAAGTQGLGGSVAGTASSAGATLGGASGGAGAAGGLSRGGNGAGTPSKAGSAGAALAGSGSGGAVACPAAPATAPAAAAQALMVVNQLRVAMGVPCMELVAELNVAAQNHCEYYAANAADDACTANAHAEVATCAGFTGKSIGERGKAAGFTGSVVSEVMAFTGDPARAVQMWVNSVWHRTPILKPWIRQMGYGGTTTPAKCDTIDFGRGPATPDDVTAVYPYDGQTGVPPSFDGSREGPEPPAPASGWPSGLPLTLYLRGGTVQAHTVEVDGSGAPLPHVWIDETNRQNGRDQYFLYTDAPLAANTKYRVRISALRGAVPLEFDWTFTTGAAGR